MATILNRFHRFSSTVMSRRHYLEADFLLLWIIQYFFPSWGCSLSFRYRGCIVVWVCECLSNVIHLYHSHSGVITHCKNQDSLFEDTFEKYNLWRWSAFIAEASAWPPESRMIQLVLWSKTLPFLSTLLHTQHVTEEIMLLHVENICTIFADQQKWKRKYGWEAANGRSTFLKCTEL